MKKFASGGLLIVFGLFMLLLFLSGTGPSTFLVGVATFLLMVLAPIAAGTFMIRSHFQAKKKSAEESRKKLLAAREKEVLMLAGRKNGILTIPEIVAETSMNADEANEIMREMVVKLYADMKITNDGEVIYNFSQLRRQKPEDRLFRLESWSEKDVN
jgi:hypothetical protein